MATCDIVTGNREPKWKSWVMPLYTVNLLADSLIVPRVVVGGRLAEVLFFGPSPVLPGYFQVNLRVPDGVAGPTVPVRLSYIGR